MNTEGANDGDRAAASGAGSPQTAGPNWGLVCITTTDEVRFKTITRTRLLTFPELEQAEILRALYAENLRRLDGAITFCHAHGIRLYRMSSALFPSSDLGVGADVLAEFAPTLTAIGNRATEIGIRLILHPEQFTVLSSENPQVVQNSIHILTQHALMLDRMAQPRSHWAMIEIHGGKSGRGDALADVIGTLPDAIRSRLALENDEDAYGAADILAVCRATHTPMVFDAHHHVCHEKLDTYEEASVAFYFEAARATWPDPDWQIVHLSNGRERFQDTRHSDLISDIPSVYARAPWIEVEAKGKEQAIALLQAGLLCDPPPRFATV